MTFRIAGTIPRRGVPRPPGGNARARRPFASFCIVLDEPVEWTALKAWYEELAEIHGDRVLRVKGIVNVRGESQPFAVHCVQSTQHAPARLPSWPDEDRRSRIVFITQNLGREEVERSLERHRAEMNHSPGAPPRPPGKKKAGPDRWLNTAELSRLFAAESEAGPVRELDTAWSAAAVRAGVDGTNLRALRPVFASHVFEGLSPGMTRTLLGLAPAP